MTRELIHVDFRTPVALGATESSWDLKRHPRVHAMVDHMRRVVEFLLPNRRCVDVPFENVGFMLFGDTKEEMVVIDETANIPPEQVREEPDGSLSYHGVKIANPLPSVPDPNTAKTEPPPMNRGQALGKLGVYDPKTGALERPCKVCGGVALIIDWEKRAGLEGRGRHETQDGTVGCTGTVREFLARVS